MQKEWAHKPRAGVFKVFWLRSLEYAGREEAKEKEVARKGGGNDGKKSRTVQGTNEKVRQRPCGSASGSQSVLEGNVSVP